MMPMMLLHLLMVSFLLPNYIVASEEGMETQSTCEAVRQGTSGRITCHYSEDIRQTYRDFSVRWYGYHDDKSVAVVMCSWLSVQDVTCVAEPGYTYGEVSNMFVVSIRNVTNQHLGRYACQGVQFVADKIIPCFLNASEELVPPSEIHQVNSTYESITISWRDNNTRNNGTTYQVRCKPPLSDEYTSVDGVLSSFTNFTIFGLVPGTDYNVSVRVLRADGESSDWSVGTVARTKGLPECTADRTLPEQPYHDASPFFVGMASALLPVTSFLVILYFQFREKRRRAGERHFQPRPVVQHDEEESTSFMAGAPSQRMQ
ncbi:hypothetical protein BaRGS_00031909 [Batillaria attramentaria]|uniref:Fibronectin type-III domain-containing protein n=1 Tax=Batillaria attramentaria TaxID=370345 RepID=A0ABD0JPP5_9CAEN